MLPENRPDLGEKALKPFPEKGRGHRQGPGAIIAWEEAPSVVFSEWGENRFRARGSFQ